MPSRLEADQKVKAIGHAVEGDQLLFDVPDDPVDVFVQFFLHLWPDNRKFECRFE